MTKTSLYIVLIAASSLVACREADEPLGTGAPAGAVVVDSDPRGGRIFVNGDPVGSRTPDTLRDLEVDRDTIMVRLDTLGLTYGFIAPLRTDPSAGATVYGPLILRCATSECLTENAVYHEPHTLRFASSPAGPLFLSNGEGNGAFWPAGTQNSYTSGGNAVLAGVAATGDTVALGPYDLRHLVGRPVPEVTDDGSGGFELEKSSWILPPAAAQRRPTIRGIEVSQRLVARDDVADVAAIRLVFRNVTDRESYASFDPGVPAGGLEYASVYVGYALDGDIGRSDDDRLSYDPGLDLAFLYDADFAEDEFGSRSDRPGLLGLRVLEAPSGTQVAMNGWPGGSSTQPMDWYAGTRTERLGWGWLSARQTIVESHTAGRIGYAPTQADDYRILVSAGPLRLAPGDSAVLTVAVALAEPAEGTYTSGSSVEPGDPDDPNRTLLRIAEPLLERAQAADSLLGAAGS